MKHYILSYSSIILAIVLSAFTKSPTTVYIFALKPGVDRTSSPAVSDKSNYRPSSILCNGNDIACGVVVDESFTNGTGINRKLNTTGTYISIQTENEYLDQSVNPAVQYIKLASGVNYTYFNDTF
jgi:hypothetical protein